MEIILGDITKLEVDAIVNAANTSLLGGSGVDGAIHRAAGSDLVDECRSLRGCKIGDAKLTKGYRLPASFIIHTVGPVWRGGNNGEPELLAQCYYKCMQIAADQDFNTVAFPCISTGIYKYPKILAAKIAVKICQEQLEKNDRPQKVIFCCYDQENYEIYTKTLAELSF
jgi:O-acetyl-ADP-ribose deacetylase (regulator of RNase III)